MRHQRNSSHGHREQRRQEAVIQGVIQHHGHFAFLLNENEGCQDVFLRGRSLDLAMDGDRVEVRARTEANGRLSGEILRVIKRARTSIIGVLKQFPRGWAVFPEKGNAPPAQVLGFAPKVTPKAGSFAVLEVTRWPSSTEGAAGTVTELIGEQDDVNSRITAMLRSRGIIESFTEEVLKEALAYGSSLDDSQWGDREQLFHLPIVTIDGADAKDFDDAVSIEPLAGGLTRLGVHIADVGHYVKPGTALDKEAYDRGTSVYLPDRVVPMLPPTLSNNLCSLMPSVERLTVSVFMDIDEEGRVSKRRMANTVIRSARRLTYEEAQDLLDGKKLPAVPKAAAQAVELMGELAKRLRGRRVKRGALDFDLPEYKIVTDTVGKPVKIVQRPRLESHRLIEEFMLLANESIATELINAKAPFLHRRHDEPDPVKIKTLAKVLGEMGIPAGHLVGGNVHKALQDIIAQVSSHPLSDIINSLIVRSMKQAVYSPKSSGHFGIAARAYAHFTSPIRRYPDLMAHRAIKALIAGKRENHGSLSLQEAGEHCSERERSASESEYRSVDLMRAELFKNMIGAVMDGVVTNVIESGSFVLCGETGAEGMLRVTDLKPGTKVKVIIDAVDTAEGKISLSLAVARTHLPAQLRVSEKKRPRHRGR